VAEALALLIADWYWPSPEGVLGVDELGFRATSQSAKNRTVATRTPISGRETWGITAIFGS
jgi:hypothetical protein